MDTSAPDIFFDAAGVCSYCTSFVKKSEGILHEEYDSRERRLKQLVAKIKASGRRKRYDCVVGVSGGVDSSWALVKSVELGLRPLAVHMDNGWNSEAAQNNIANLVRGLDVDLFTYVIDWDEYRGLMQAFFDADVVDIELLYDNSMLAVNYKQAARYGVKFILSGVNTTSEGMRMPRSWVAHKFDRRNIKKIAQRFGGIKLRSFPSMGTLSRVYYEFIKKTSWVSFLDYFEYNKFVATESLSKNYGFKQYPYKHYESIFTRFYQGYILPEKFSFDKRRLHLSTLIIAGQMSRETALIDLKSIAYPNLSEQEEDRKYFLKKMHWSNYELDFYLSRNRREHGEFGSEEKFYNLIKSVYTFFSRSSS